MLSLTPSGSGASVGAGVVVVMGVVVGEAVVVSMTIDSLSSNASLVTKYVVTAVNTMRIKTDNNNSPSVSLFRIQTAFLCFLNRRGVKSSIEASFVVRIVVS